MKAYGLKKCSTCRDALAFLAERNVHPDFADHVETPPTKQQVARWSKAVGGWEKLVNRSGYTWRGLDDAAKADLTEAKAVALAVKHSSLIRRPLLEHDDGSVTVGFTAKVKQRFVRT
jgi:arsenate reductase (glutaredoxin)